MSWYSGAACWQHDQRSVLQGGNVHAVCHVQVK